MALANEPLFSAEPLNEPSIVDVLNELLKKSNVDFLTEINNPLIFSFLEVASKQLRGQNLSYSADIIQLILARIKYNMIAKDRKRVEEIIKGIANASGVIEAEEKEKLTNKLLGKAPKV